MSYVDENLSKGESIVARGQIHWYIYVPSSLVLVIGLILFADPELSPLGGILALLGLLFLLRAIITAVTTELAVTTKRVIAKFGFISRRTVELNHSKVESFNVSQGIAGRILNFGTIVINGTGGVHTPIPKISNPLDFRRAAMQAIEDL